MKRFVMAALMLVATGAMAQQHKISVQKYEVPVYPPIARAAHMQAEVQLSLEITEVGVVKSALVRSVTITNIDAAETAKQRWRDLFSEIAIRSVRKWRFHCDDCSYGASFKHEMAFTFTIEDPRKRTVPSMEFPDRIVIYATPVECDHC